MITLAFPPGLLLLLLIPPIVLLARRRAIPRRVELTAFFLLEEVLRLKHRHVPRIFRLSRSQRLAIVAVMLASLSLAAAGAGWQRRSGVPRRLLLVVDNIPTASRDFSGETAASAILSRVEDDAREASRHDSTTLLVTSPRPALATYEGGRGLARAVGAASPAAEFPSVESAAAEVLSIAASYDRTVVLSPRAPAWRRVFTGLPARPALPPDREVVRGNAGVVSVRTRPSAVTASAWDVAVTVAARDAGLPATVRLEQDGRLLASGTPDAAGELTFTGIHPVPGPLAVAIAGGDAYPADDRIVMSLPGDEPVTASVTGTGADLAAAAIRAATGAGPLPRGKAAVDVFLGDPPGALSAPSLVMAPSTELPGLEFRELAGIASDAAWHPLHPITAGLTGETIRPDRAVAFGVTGNFTSIASAEGVPLVLAGDVDGRRTVVWSFSPLDGGLFLKPEFVILLKETLRWLGQPPAADPSPAPSAALTAEAAEISLPDLSAPLFPGERTSTETVPLLLPLLALFLAAGLYLAVSDSFSAGEPQDR